MPFQELVLPLPRKYKAKLGRKMLSIHINGMTWLVCLKLCLTGHTEHQKHKIEHAFLSVIQTRYLECVFVETGGFTWDTKFVYSN